MNPDPEVPLGALWRRVVARLLDMLTALAVSLALVLLGLAPVIDRLSSRFDPQPWGHAFVATVMYAMVAFVYEVVFVATRGQTPGKDLLDLKVISVATGRHPSWGVAILRAVPMAVLRLVPGPLFGTLAEMLLGVSAPFDRRRRALHDFLAGTIVIQYCSDDEDDDTDGIDRQALADTYGPRSFWDYLTRRRDD